MRRWTRITLIVLFLVLVSVTIAQLVMATGDRAPLQGPTSPGQLPPTRSQPATPVP